MSTRPESGQPPQTIEIVTTLYDGTAPIYPSNDQDASDTMVYDFNNVHYYIQLLINAISHNSPHYLKCLPKFLSIGGNINTSLLNYGFPSYYTLLMLAAVCNSDLWIAPLIQHGADYHYTDHVYHRTLLHWCLLPALQSTTITKKGKMMKNDDHNMNEASMGNGFSLQTILTLKELLKFITTPAYHNHRDINNWTPVVCIILTPFQFSIHHLTALKLLVDGCNVIIDFHTGQTYRDLQLTTYSLNNNLGKADVLVKNDRKFEKLSDLQHDHYYNSNDYIIRVLPYPPYQYYFNNHHDSSGSAQTPNLLHFNLNNFDYPDSTESEYPPNEIKIGKNEVICLERDVLPVQLSTIQQMATYSHYLEKYLEKKYVFIKNTNLLWLTMLTINQFQHWTPQSQRVLQYLYDMFYLTPTIAILPATGPNPTPVSTSLFSPQSPVPIISPSIITNKRVNFQDSTKTQKKDETSDEESYFQTITTINTLIANVPNIFSRSHTIVMSCSQYNNSLSTNNASSSVSQPLLLTHTNTPSISPHPITSGSGTTTTNAVNLIILQTFFSFFFFQHDITAPQYFWLLSQPIANIAQSQSGSTITAGKEDFTVIENYMMDYIKTFKTKVINHNQAIFHPVSKANSNNWDTLVANYHNIFYIMLCNNNIITDHYINILQSKIMSALFTPMLMTKQQTNHTNIIKYNERLKTLKNYYILLYLTNIITSDKPLIPTQYLFILFDAFLYDIPLVGEHVGEYSKILKQLEKNNLSQEKTQNLIKYYVKMQPEQHKISSKNYPSLELPILQYDFDIYNASAVGQKVPNTAASTDDKADILNSSSNFNMITSFYQSFRHLPVIPSSFTTNLHSTRILSTKALIFHLMSGYPSLSIIHYLIARGHAICKQWEKISYSDIPLISALSPLFLLFDYYKGGENCFNNSSYNISFLKGSIGNEKTQNIYSSKVSASLDDTCLSSPSNRAKLTPLSSNSKSTDNVPPQQKSELVQILELFLHYNVDIFKRDENKCSVVYYLLNNPYIPPYDVFNILSLLHQYGYSCYTMYQDAIVWMVLKCFSVEKTGLSSYSRVNSLSSEKSDAKTNNTTSTAHNNIHTNSHINTDMILKLFGYTTQHSSTIDLFNNKSLMNTFNLLTAQRDLLHEHGLTGVPFNDITRCQALKVVSRKIKKIKQAKDKNAKKGQINRDLLESMKYIDHDAQNLGADDFFDDDGDHSSIELNPDDFYANNSDDHVGSDSDHNEGDDYVGEHTDRVSMHSNVSFHSGASVQLSKKSVYSTYTTTTASASSAVTKKTGSSGSRLARVSTGATGNIHKHNLFLINNSTLAKNNHTIPYYHIKTINPLFSATNHSSIQQSQQLYELPNNTIHLSYQHIKSTKNAQTYGDTAPIPETTAPVLSYTALITLIDFVLSHGVDITLSLSQLDQIEHTCHHDKIATVLQKQQTEIIAARTAPSNKDNGNQTTRSVIHPATVTLTLDTGINKMIVEDYDPFNDDDDELQSSLVHTIKLVTTPVPSNSPSGSDDTDKVVNDMKQLQNEVQNASVIINPNNLNNVPTNMSSNNVNVANADDYDAFSDDEPVTNTLILTDNQQQLAKIQSQTKEKSTKNTLLCDLAPDFLLNLKIPLFSTLNQYSSYSTLGPRIDIANSSIFLLFLFFGNYNLHNTQYLYDYFITLGFGMEKELVVINNTSTSGSKSDAFRFADFFYTLLLHNFGSFSSQFGLQLFALCLNILFDNNNLPYLTSQLHNIIVSVIFSNFYGKIGGSPNHFYKNAKIVSKSSMLLKTHIYYNEQYNTNTNAQQSIPSGIFPSSTAVTVSSSSQSATSAQSNATSLPVFMLSPQYWPIFLNFSQAWKQNSLNVSLYKESAYIPHYVSYNTINNNNSRGDINKYNYDNPNMNTNNQIKYVNLLLHIYLNYFIASQTAMSTVSSDIIVNYSVSHKAATTSLKSSFTTKNVYKNMILSNIHEISKKLLLTTYLTQTNTHIQYVSKHHPLVPFFISNYNAYSKIIDIFPKIVENVEKTAVNIEKPIKKTHIPLSKKTPTQLLTEHDSDNDDYNDISDDEFNDLYSSQSSKVERKDKKSLKTEPIYHNLYNRENIPLFASFILTLYLSPTDLLPLLPSGLREQCIDQLLSLDEAEIMRKFDANKIEKKNGDSIPVESIDGSVPVLPYKNQFINPLLCQFSQLSSNFKKSMEHTLSLSTTPHSSSGQIPTPPDSERMSLNDETTEASLQSTYSTDSALNTLITPNSSQQALLLATAAPMTRTMSSLDEFMSSPSDLLDPLAQKKPQTFSKSAQLFSQMKKKQLGEDYHRLLGYICEKLKYPLYLHPSSYPLATKFFISTANPLTHNNLSINLANILHNPDDACFSAQHCAILESLLTYAGSFIFICCPYHTQTSLYPLLHAVIHESSLKVIDANFVKVFLLIIQFYALRDAVILSDIGYDFRETGLVVGGNQVDSTLNQKEGQPVIVMSDEKSDFYDDDQYPLYQQHNAGKNLGFAENGPVLYNLSYLTYTMLLNHPLLASLQLSPTLLKHPSMVQLFLRYFPLLITNVFLNNTVTSSAEDQNTDSRKKGDDDEKFYTIELLKHLIALIPDDVTKHANINPLFVINNTMNYNYSGVSLKIKPASFSDSDRPVRRDMYYSLPFLSFNELLTFGKSTFDVALINYNPAAAQSLTTPYGGNDYIFKYVTLQYSSQLLQQQVDFNYMNYYPLPPTLLLLQKLPVCIQPRQPLSQMVSMTFITEPADSIAENNNVSNYFYSLNNDKNPSASNINFESITPSIPSTPQPQLAPAVSTPSVGTPASTSYRANLRQTSLASPSVPPTVNTAQISNINSATGAINVVIDEVQQVTTLLTQIVHRDNQLYNTLHLLMYIIGQDNGLSGNNAKNTVSIRLFKLFFPKLKAFFTSPSFLVIPVNYANIGHVKCSVNTNNANNIQFLSILTYIFHPAIIKAIFNYQLYYNTGHNSTSHLQLSHSQHGVDVNIETYHITSPVNSTPTPNPQNNPNNVDLTHISSFITLTNTGNSSYNHTRHLKEVQNGRIHYNFPISGYTSTKSFISAAVSSHFPYCTSKHTYNPFTANQYHITSPADLYTIPHVLSNNYNQFNCNTNNNHFNNLSFFSEFLTIFLRMLNFNPLLLVDININNAYHYNNIITTTIAPFISNISNANQYSLSNITSSLMSTTKSIFSSVMKRATVPTPATDSVSGSGSNTSPAAITRMTSTPTTTITPSTLLLTTNHSSHLRNLVLMSYFNDNFTLSPAIASSSTTGKSVGGSMQSGTSWNNSNDFDFNSVNSILFINAILFNPVYFSFESLLFNIYRQFNYNHFIITSKRVATVSSKANKMIAKSKIQIPTTLYNLLLIFIYNSMNINQHFNVNPHLIAQIANNQNLVSAQNDKSSKGLKTPTSMTDINSIANNYPRFIITQAQIDSTGQNVNTTTTYNIPQYQYTYTILRYVLLLFHQIIDQFEETSDHTGIIDEDDQFEDYQLFYSFILYLLSHGACLYTADIMEYVFKISPIVIRKSVHHSVTMHIQQQQQQDRALKVGTVHLSDDDEDKDDNEPQNNYKDLATLGLVRHQSTSAVFSTPAKPIQIASEDDKNEKAEKDNSINDPEEVHDEYDTSLTTPAKKVKKVKKIIVRKGTKGGVTTTTPTSGTLTSSDAPSSATVTTTPKPKKIVKKEKPAESHTSDEVLDGSLPNKHQDDDDNVNYHNEIDNEEPPAKFEKKKIKYQHISQRFIPHISYHNIPIILTPSYQLQINNDPIQTHNAVASVKSSRHNQLFNTVLFYQHHNLQIHNQFPTILYSFVFHPNKDIYDIININQQQQQQYQQYLLQLQTQHRMQQQQMGTNVLLSPNLDKPTQTTNTPPISEKTGSSSSSWSFRSYFKSSSSTPNPPSSSSSSSSSAAAAPSTSTSTSVNAAANATTAHNAYHTIIPIKQGELLSYKLLSFADFILNKELLTLNHITTHARLNGFTSKAQLQQYIKTTFIYIPPANISSPGGGTNLLLNTNNLNCIVNVNIIPRITLDNIPIIINNQQVIRKRIYRFLQQNVLINLYDKYFGEADQNVLTDQQRNDGSSNDCTDQMDIMSLILNPYAVDSPDYAQINAVNVARNERFISTFQNIHLTFLTLIKDLNSTLHNTILDKSPVEKTSPLSVDQSSQFYDYEQNNGENETSTDSVSSLYHIYFNYSSINKVRNKTPYASASEQPPTLIYQENPYNPIISTSGHASHTGVSPGGSLSPTSPGDISMFGNAYDNTIAPAPPPHCADGTVGLLWYTILYTNITSQLPYDECMSMIMKNHLHKKAVSNQLKRGQNAPILSNYEQKQLVTERIVKNMKYYDDFIYFLLETLLNPTLLYSNISLMNHHDNDYVELTSDNIQRHYDEMLAEPDYFNTLQSSVTKINDFTFKEIPSKNNNFTDSDDNRKKTPNFYNIMNKNNMIKLLFYNNKQQHILNYMILKYYNNQTILVLFLFYLLILFNFNLKLFYNVFLVNNDLYNNSTKDYLYYTNCYAFSPLFVDILYQIEFYVTKQHTFMQVPKTTHQNTLTNVKSSTQTSQNEHLPEESVSVVTEIDAGSSYLDEVCLGLDEL